MTIDGPDDGGLTGGTKRAFAGLFVATAATMLGIGIIVPILPLYAENMGASGVVLGLIFAGFALSRGVTAPVIGRVSDQYGRKRLLVVGLAGYSLLSIGYVFAPTPLVVAAIRTAQGFTSVMVTPIAQSYVADITPPGREGEFMNLFYISMFGGMAIGPSIGGYLADAYSFAAPFYAMAAVGGVAMALIVVLVTESPAADDGPSGEALSISDSLRAVARDRQMRGLIAYISARGFYRWGFNAFFPVFAVSAIAFSRTEVGVLLSGYMVAGGLLQYPLGRLADRLAHYRTAFIVGGSTLSAVSMLVLTTFTHVVAIAALVVGMGVFSAISRASAVAIRTERGRVHGQGVITGAFTTSMSAGQVLGPLAFGMVVDLLDIQAAFYLGGIVGLAGTAGAYWFLRGGPPAAEAGGVGTGGD